MAFFEILLSSLSFSSCLQTFLACSATYTILWILYCKTLHPLAKIPGPFWASVTRLWYMYRIYAGDIDTVLRGLHKKHGNLVRIAPNEVSSSNPADLPLVYRNFKPLDKTDFYDPWRPVGWTGNQAELFGTRDEVFHAQLRKTLNPVYTMSNILKHEKYVRECTTLLVQRLGECADNVGHETVNLQRWMQMYAFDVVGALFYGSMFGFLETRQDHEDKMASIRALIPIMAMVSIAPTYYRPVIWISSLFSSVVRAGMQGMGRITEAAVEAVVKRKQEIKDGAVERTDLLQQMLDIADNKEKSFEFGEDDVKLQSWAAMFAGSDTTAVAMSVCLYHLIKHTTCMKKVEAELESAGPTLSSPIKYLESQRLPYLCACIKEAMRLYPSVTLGLQRTVPPGGMILSDRHIAGGFRVSINATVVSYDESVVGPDAGEFKPERWLDTDKEKVLALERASSLNFGGGTRTCSGKHISLVEIHTAVPEILRRFKFEMDGDWTLTPRWFYRIDDFNVKISRRGLPYN